MSSPQKLVLNKRLPIIYAFIVFTVLFIAALNYNRFTKGQWEKDERSNLLDMMTSKKSNLEKALYSRIYYTRGVAAYVGLNPKITNEEFYQLAKEYVKNDTVISSMALSKNCIINAIYPLEEHESAIGLNLLEHAERKDIVEKTIKTTLTFVAGPLELVEGGNAFISYTPIFNKKEINPNQFWGITDIVIKVNSLFKEAKLSEHENGFKFALKGYNGTGDNSETFWGDPKIFDKNPVLIDVNLPIGNWVMAAIPNHGWGSYLDQDKTLLIILLFSSFIISLLIWVIVRSFLRIKQNEKELKAIFNSLDSLIVEFNSKGDYLKINYNNINLLYKPEKDLIGKNIKDIFQPEKATMLLNAIQQCLSTKKLVIIEYPLTINDKIKWFSARITFKSNETVILNAFDITEEKRKEDELKKLNAMKDQFFSIIAHDLKNPAGTQKAFIDLLLERFDTFNVEKQKTLLQTIQKSSNQLFNLLENLLKWSLSQTGIITAKKVSFSIYDKNQELFSLLKIQADLKDINFSNIIDPKIKVNADPDLTAIIIRNLISNAIKFTNRNGSVTISSETTFENGEKYLKINISDTGIGVPDEKFKKLFNISKTQSTPGTENERGSGLGLLLCKDFSEKQGGKFYIKSQIGKGSIFSFTLPISN
ncbi:sensor histidine kinase [Lutibacter citreus]|uniref:sensor histidine kinase n=1 Tax=Lutibacter citreus TaxID=2138210 RepID=UPI000DBE04E7|nr:ATP-binding protein [Lutibacter citreus]